MKLLAKFNLIVGLVLGAGAGGGGGGCRTNSCKRAHGRGAAAGAADDSGHAIGARFTTSKQVKPLLVTQAEHQENVPAADGPAFAATENFAQLRVSYPDYAYKEAVLEPDHPRDRAVEWEADVINVFRGQSQRGEGNGRRTGNADRRALYIARPIRPPAVSRMP